MPLLSRKHGKLSVLLNLAAVKAGIGANMDVKLIENKCDYSFFCNCAADAILHPVGEQVNPPKFNYCC
jgi:hypothetical protein